MNRALSQCAGDRLSAPVAALWGVSRVPMKTRGEVESAVCEFIGRVQQQYVGRGPRDIRAHLIGDLLVVRLQGVLTAAEQQMVKSLASEKGRDLLKQVRTHLIETARPVMEAMIQKLTGVKILSLHHDISTVTGEEVMLFTLSRTPDYRQPKYCKGHESKREL